MSKILEEVLAANREYSVSFGEKSKDVGKGPGSRAGEYIEWLTIPDQAQSVRDDVERIRNHPLVPADIAVYGYIFDVKSGRLIDVDLTTVTTAEAA